MLWSCLSAFIATRIRILTLGHGGLIYSVVLSRLHDSGNRYCQHCRHEYSCFFPIENTLMSTTILIYFRPFSVVENSFSRLQCFFDRCLAFLVPNSFNRIAFCWSSHRFSSGQALHFPRIRLVDLCALTLSTDF